MAARGRLLVGVGVAGSWARAQSRAGTVGMGHERRVRPEAGMGQVGRAAQRAQTWLGWRREESDVRVASRWVGRRHKEGCVRAATKWAGRHVGDGARRAA